MTRSGALLVLTSLAACGGGDSVSDVMAGMAEGRRVEYTLKGRVLGPDGRAVEKTRVHYDAALLQDGEADSRNQGYVQAEEDGRFLRVNWAAWSVDGRAVEPEKVRIRIELQASDHFGLYEPSPVRKMELQNGGTADLELRLGAPRPTVPVCVVDSAGEPVREYWLQVLADTTEDAPPLPQRWGTFPDGTTELAVIDRPFRVKAYLHGGERETVVGPFDPRDLPARIDITLVD